MSPGKQECHAPDQGSSQPDGTTRRRLVSAYRQSRACSQAHRDRYAPLSSPLLSGVLVGEAEDTDVSGSISPFKRPKPGKWLTSRADECDVIIAARMDRLTRRSMHFNELLEWAQENGKFIVCVEEGFRPLDSSRQDDGSYDCRLCRGRVGHHSGAHLDQDLYVTSISVAYSHGGIICGSSRDGKRRGLSGSPPSSTNSSAPRGFPVSIRTRVRLS